MLGEDENTITICMTTKEHKRIKALKSKIIMDDEWRDRWVSRWVDLLAVFNKMANNFFPNAGGIVNEFISPNLEFNGELLILLLHKKLYLRVPCKNDIILKPGEPSRCHQNVDALFVEKQIDKKHFGLSLGETGGWRFHSWGSMNDGTIVETTVKAPAYITYQPYGDIEMDKTFDHEYDEDELAILETRKDQMRKMFEDEDAKRQQQLMKNKKQLVKK